MLELANRGCTTRSFHRHVWASLNVLSSATECFARRRVSRTSSYLRIQYSMAAPAPKRQSALPPLSGPKPPVQFSSSITISDTASLTGTNLITVSSESVIHPRARLESLSGSITIGRRCIIHERTKIGHMGTEGKVLLTDNNSAVVLGDYVTVEVGAVVEAGGTIIGDGTVVGVGSRVGTGAIVGKVC